MKLKKGEGVICGRLGMSALMLLFLLLIAVPGTATITPDFSITDQAGMEDIDFPVNDLLTLTDTSITDETILDRTWTVTGGSLSSPLTSKNETFTLPVLDTGTYTVIFQAYGSSAGLVSVSDNFTITDYSNYVNADFTTAAGLDSAPYNLSLIDESQDNGGVVIYWYWKIGSQKYTTQTPILTVSPGTYAVNLTVCDDTGYKSAISKFISVPPFSFSAPQADFSFLNVSDGTNRTIQFNDTSLYNASSWHWNFGDNSTSFEKNPKHVYKLFGSYLVSLLVSNGGGTDMCTKQVQILSPLNWSSPTKAGFSVNQTGTGLRTFGFTNASTGFLTGEFNFDDGTTESVDSDWSTVYHTFTEYGNHNVTLTVTDGTIPNVTSKWVFVS